MKTFLKFLLLWFLSIFFVIIDMVLMTPIILIVAPIYYLFTRKSLFETYNTCVGYMLFEKLCNRLEKSNHNINT